VMRSCDPDGSEGEGWGNGTRCGADPGREEDTQAALSPETLRGTLLATRRDGIVAGDMGAALLDWTDIPLVEATDTLHLPIGDGPLADPVAVGMGNPHCVFFVNDAEAIDLETLGPVIEHNPLYPQRTNVEVASLTGDGGIRLRVWERGAGITLACGSGTCATAVAAHRRGLIDAESTPVVMTVDGGAMTIQYRASTDGHVIMSGPVATSFVGEMAL